MPNIGFLCSGSRREFAHLLAAFRDGLKLQGYQVVSSAPKGRKDIRIHAAWADGDYSKLPGKAKPLIDKRVQVLAVTGGLASLKAAEGYAAAAGSNIPIVFIAGRGKSKPGDHGPNAKGIHLGTTSPKVEDHNRHKRLRELVGRNAHINMLINKDSPVHDDEKKWGKSVMAGTVGELSKAFATAVNVNKAAALFVSADPVFNRNRAEIIRLAKKYKIPACYPWREYVEAGGLMSHGPNLANVYRRLGIWAAMVLDGTKLQDLPAADAGHREFVINLKTAKALGLTIPGTLLVRADAVIQ